ncbi:hypothetical protein [Belliella pelovolcani]|nr:hypothetical protein [Belliella pelovolcani]
MGGGRTVSFFTPASQDQHYGYGAIIQRQIYLNDGKFSFTPTLQGSILTDKQYSLISPQIYASTTLGLHLNYDLLSIGKFRLTPFIGPSFIWATGLRSGSDFFENDTSNFYRSGLEGGVSLSYFFSDKFSMKVIPLTYTWGTKDFVQGDVLRFLFQIM